MSWEDQANCKGSLHIFYIGNGAGSTKARKMCSACPVKAECLADALTYERTVPLHLIIGYRAGMTARQRADLLRASLAEEDKIRARHAICGTDSGYYKHRKLKETPCDDCKAAHSAATYDRVQRNGRPSRARKVA